MIENASSRKILGIDPGLQTVGFGCIESDGRHHRFLAGGVITTSSKDETPKRLEEIYDHLQELLAELQPDLVSMEKLFFVKNVTSGIRVAQAQGSSCFGVQESRVTAFRIYSATNQDGLERLRPGN